MEQDVFYGGKNINITKVLKLEGCRALCQQYPECVGWSWALQEVPSSSLKCFVKTKLENKMEIQGVVSGLRECKGNYFYFILPFYLSFVSYVYCVVVLVQVGPTIRNTVSPKQVCPSSPPCQPQPKLTAVFLQIRNRKWPLFGSRRVASAWYQTKSLVGW